MTLYDLVNGTMVQGDVRISVWKDDEEIKVKEFTYVDDLSYNNIDEFLDMTVSCIFCGGDGYLHIELC